MAGGDVAIEWVDGLPVRLREPCDLSFLRRWGRVFAIFDNQDSGNLCFGVQGPAGRVFVKVAGTRPVRYDGEVPDAVERLGAAADAYRALAAPELVRLREAVDQGPGCALVFDWCDGVSLGRQYGLRDRLSGLTVAQRSAAVQRLLDFHVLVAARGWVEVDLYDGSLLLDPVSGALTVCDIDLYRRAPAVNDMGRMWGSDRFMAPEEYQLGAPLDEVTTVFTLGSLAHTLLGDDVSKDADAWIGAAHQLAVAERARQAERPARWQSVAELADAWRRATRQGWGVT